jgi:zinc transport system substrate-binding protein
MWKRVPALLLAVSTLLGGCVRASNGSVPLRIVVALYPLAFISSELVEAAEVTNLGTGGDPHDLELSPEQIGRINTADLFVYLGGGFQPAVEDAAGSTDARALDVLEVLRAGGLLLREEDPHVWLDPALMAEIAGAIAEEVIQARPDLADSVEQQTEELRDRLVELAEQFRLGLAGCEVNHIVSAHASFGYLADAYGLRSLGITADPESEPTPRRLEEVVEYVRSNGVTTIFYDESPGIAETVAGETGAEVARLNSLEAPPEEGDYLDVMRSNLQVLREGLRCR